MLESNVTMEPTTPMFFLVLAEWTAHSQDAETESLIQMNSATVHLAFAPNANFCVETDSWMPEKNVMTEVTTAMFDETLAEAIVPDQNVETVFLIQMNNVIMEQPMLSPLMLAVHGARSLDAEMELLILNTANLATMETTSMEMVALQSADPSVEMEELILERIVTTELPTPMPQALAVEQTANILDVVMESLIQMRSVTMDLQTPLDQTLVVLTVPNPSVVMVLLTISTMRFATKDLAILGLQLMVAHLPALLMPAVNPSGLTQPLTLQSSFQRTLEFMPTLVL